MLLKALIEGLAGKKLSTAPTRRQPGAAAPAAPARTSGGKPRETTQAEFDELCAAFGVPAEMHLLIEAAKKNQAAQGSTE